MVSAALSKVCIDSKRLTIPYSSTEEGRNDLKDIDVAHDRVFIIHLLSNALDRLIHFADLQYQDPSRYNLRNVTRINILLRLFRSQFITAINTDYPDLLINDKTDLSNTYLQVRRNLISLISCKDLAHQADLFELVISDLMRILAVLKSQ